MYASIIVNIAQPYHPILTGMRPLFFTLVVLKRRSHLLHVVPNNTEKRYLLVGLFTLLA